KNARQVSEGLRSANVRSTELNGSLLADPSSFLNKSGEPYQVYTAFQRSLLHSLRPGKLLPTPRSLRSPPKWPTSQPLESLGLMPKIRWYETMETTWRIGEAGAHAMLKAFVSSRLSNYNRARDFPAERGTSRLSPHLHFGEIDPLQIWHAVRAAGGSPA